MKTMTRITLAGMALAMATGTALADDRGGWGRSGKDGNGAGMMQRFEDMDADGNGTVTLAEFSAPLIERFDNADADKDGTLTLAELREAMPRRAAERAPMLLARFDVDRNDSVTRDELANRQAKMFALLDMDDSGGITKEELPARMKRGGKDRGGWGR